MYKLFSIGAFMLSLLISCNNTQSPHTEHNHDDHSACTEEHGHDHEHDGHDHEDVHAHEHGAKSAAENHSDEIIFTPQQAEKAGLEYYTVEPVTFHEVITTSGQILPAQGDEITMAATVSGVISFGNIQLSEGKNVNKRENLFYISSKNVAEGDYLARTKAAYEQALAAYERSQSLVKEMIISQKEFEQSKFNYETARTAYEAVSKNSSSRGTGVLSPLSGYVKSVLVKEGDYVTVGQPVAVVSQNQRLVLQAEVSQRYYNALRKITTANFETPYDNKVYSLDSLRGKLLSFGKSTGNGSFFLPVSFEFDNKGSVIPGSFVSVYLISSPLENVLAIPASALTEEQGTYFVYVRLDEEGYQKREVQLGAGDGERVQILSGLKNGETIVSKGAYQVRLASVSSVIPEGHTHNH